MKFKKKINLNINRFRFKCRRVSIRRITTDRYGRTVAELSIDGINVQQFMVVNGWGKIYERYADPCHWAQ